jgi:hypothetical protein
MDWSAEVVVPAARSDRLVVERLGDELLIYDLDADQAHHLNPAAAVLFELCDGRTTVGELAARAAARLDQPFTEATAGEAVEQLAGRGLLVGEPRSTVGVSRREVVRRAVAVGAGAAVAGPVIKSIVAPTPAMAQSPPCVEKLGECTVSEQCCEGLVCCGASICFPGPCTP